MTFPEFLRAEVLRLGRGTSSHGEQLAAIVLGWSPRKVRSVMYEGAEIDLAAQTGARLLLPKAKPLPPKAYPTKSAPQ